MSPPPRRFRSRCCFKYPGTVSIPFPESSASRAYATELAELALLEAELLADEMAEESTDVTDDAEEERASVRLTSVGSCAVVQIGRAHV